MMKFANRNMNISYINLDYTFSFSGSLFLKKNREDKGFMLGRLGRLLETRTIQEVMFSSSIILYLSHLYSWLPG